MLSKKPPILLLFKGAAGELDWIIPLIFQLSKNHSVFTYFRSRSAYEIIRNTKEIYYYWKNINEGYFVDSIYHNFHWKLLRKVCLFFFKNEKNIYFFNRKIHDINFLKKKLLGKNLNNDFKFVFSEYNYPNGWLNSILEKNNKSLIVHYPHSPWISFLKKTFKSTYKLNGDILLLSGKGDLNRWKDFIDIKKIHSFGIPRFDSSWSKRIVDLGKKNLIKKKNKFIVTIPYKSFFDLYPKQKNVLEKQFHDILETLIDIPNIIIIFKIHPKINSNYFYDLLSKYKKFKKRIIVSNTHLYILAKNSNLFICATNTSTIFDSIYFKVPTIQFWPAFKNINRKENINNFYEKKNISIIFKNKKELKKILNDLTKKKNNAKWILQQKNFSKFYKDRNSISKIISFLQKSHNKKFEKKETN